MVAAFHHLTKAENQSDPDIQEWEIRNRQFHLALVSCCHSPWLMRFHETLYDQHKRYRNIARIDRSSRRNVHEEHVAICNAALAKDVEALCKANEEEIRRLTGCLAANFSIVRAETPAAALDQVRDLGAELRRLDVGSLGNATLFMLILLMWIGGGPGSAAGGGSSAWSCGSRPAPASRASCSTAP